MLGWCGSFIASAVAQPEAGFFPFPRLHGPDARILHAHHHLSLNCTSASRKSAATISSVMQSFDSAVPPPPLRTLPTSPTLCRYGLSVLRLTCVYGHTLASQCVGHSREIPSSHSPTRHCILSSPKAGGVATRIQTDTRSSKRLHIHVSPVF